MHKVTLKSTASLWCSNQSKGGSLYRVTSECFKQINLG